MPIHLHIDKLAYLPKEILQGTVSWEKTGYINPKFILIQLLWYTEGEGNCDSDIITEKRIKEPNPAGNESFTFELPAFPWSYQGKLISIHWSVQAHLGRGERTETRIICGPQNKIFNNLLPQIDPHL